jgi:hypothetical protein
MGSSRYAILLSLSLPCVACGQAGNDTYSGVLTRTRTCPGEASVSEQYNDTVSFSQQSASWVANDPVCPQMQITSTTDLASISSTQCQPATLFGTAGTMTFTSGSWTLNGSDLDVFLDGTVALADANGNATVCGLQVQGVLMSDAAAASTDPGYFYCPP